MTVVSAPSRRHAALDTGAEPAPSDSSAAAGRSHGRTIWRALATVSVIAAAVVMVVVVATNARLLREATRSAQHASTGWLLVTVAAMGLSFLASGIGLVGASQGRVPVGRTVAAEFAGAFCNRLTPAGVGRTALRVRYLVCAGLTVERAASAVALSSLIGAFAYLGGMAAAGMDMRSAAATIVVSPGARAAFVGSVALLIIATVMVLYSHRWKHSRMCQRLRAHRRILITEIGDLAHDRWAMTALLLGPAISSAGYIVAFWAALRSVGLDIGLTSAAIIYVTSTAVAAAVPVPGGIGAAEVTLTAGLTASGLSPGTALSGVLVFRLASLWLPSLVGAATMIWLKRVGALTAESDVVARSSRRDAVRRRLQRLSRHRRLGELTLGRRMAIAGGAVAAVTLVGTTSIAAEPLSVSPPAAVTESGP